MDPHLPTDEEKVEVVEKRTISKSSDETEDAEDEEYNNTHTLNLSANNVPTEGTPVRNGSIVNNRKPKKSKSNSGRPSFIDDVEPVQKLSRSQSKSEVEKPTGHRRGASMQLLSRSFMIVRETLIDTIIHFLESTDGRNKLFMLVQYACQLAGFIVQKQETHHRKLRTVEDVMSEARKTLRYLKFIEEGKKMAQKMGDYRVGQRIKTILSVLSQLCSILYLISDHLVLIVQLNLLQMSRTGLENLKITKSRWSFWRIILLFIQDGWSFVRGEFTSSGLLWKYLEHLSNFIIAGNGYKLWNLNDGILGASGVVAALIACINFLKLRLTQYS